MRKLLGLFIILIIGFTSCEGRKTQYQSLSEDIEEFKKLNVIEKVSYYPEDYTETVNDTILNNGYKIQVKYFSDMQKSIEKEYTKDDIKFRNYYREFNSEVSISFKSKTIFNQLIDKEFLSQKGNIPYQKFKNLRLENMWIDQTESINSTRIDLLYSEIAGADVDIVHLKLIVYKDGNYDLEEV